MLSYFFLNFLLLGSTYASFCNALSFGFFAGLNVVVFFDLAFLDLYSLGTKLYAVLYSVSDKPKAEALVAYISNISVSAFNFSLFKISSDLLDTAFKTFENAFTSSSCNFPKSSPPSKNLAMVSLTFLLIPLLIVFISDLMSKEP